MFKVRYVLPLATVICVSLWLPLAIGQSTRGTVSGTAKDHSLSPLQGALMELEPTGKKAVTDTQGEFRITDVAPGNYTVTVSYVGFSPFSQTVKVESGQAAAVDAVLQVASQTDQVLVHRGAGAGGGGGLQYRANGGEHFTGPAGESDHQSAEYEHCRRRRPSAQCHAGAG